MSGERTARHDYADEIGVYFADFGLPPIPGRILGWLMVCEPPHQSPEQLAEALDISRGSVSMAMRMLQSNNAVERVAVAGSRATHWRLRPGFWLEEAAAKAKQAREWIKKADRGLDLLAEAPSESRRRLEEAKEMYTFLADQYERIESLWHEQRKQ
ncbi:GbsR/MarR family transcriptional regulator [Glycomyces harbinensis]|uniref:DNA-binding transcriptional regulator GbsR, MarR family n=1 Tax=Glycomyces harbinensis TaxID=58114 RepID=A0A1G6XP19_9ACTN|nr:transcriptional regulator [Glycomyces harbinensis]SDD79969.1 DNA-binding transcriptional regulator GbsR, MarR family [Glycomyces harbinensis]